MNVVCETIQGRTRQAVYNNNVLQYEEWRKDGALDREDGPAVTERINDQVTEKYYTAGKLRTGQPGIIRTADNYVETTYYDEEERIHGDPAILFITDNYRSIEIREHGAMPIGCYHERSRDNIIETRLFNGRDDDLVFESYYDDGSVRKQHYGRVVMVDGRPDYQLRSDNVCERFWINGRIIEETTRVNGAEFITIYNDNYIVEHYSVNYPNKPADVVVKAGSKIMRLWNTDTRVGIEGEYIRTNTSFDLIAKTLFTLRDEVNRAYERSTMLQVDVKRLNDQLAIAKYENEQLRCRVGGDFYIAAESSFISKMAKKFENGTNLLQ